jgi:hypothetical protein
VLEQYARTFEIIWAYRIDIIRKCDPPGMRREIAAMERGDHDRCDARVFRMACVRRLGDD